MFESQRKMFFQVPMSITYPRKLDTALRNTTTSSYKYRLQLGKPSFDDKLFTNALSLIDSELDPRVVAENQHLWPRLVSDMLEGKLQVSDTAPYRRISELVSKHVEIQLKHNNRQNRHGNSRLKQDHLDMYSEKMKSIPPEIHHMGYLASKLEKIVERLGLLEDSRFRSESDKLAHIPAKCIYKDKELGMDLAWSRNLAFLKYRDIETIVPRDYILLMHNKCSDILSMLLFSYLSDGAGLEHGCFNTTVVFLQEMASVIRLYGNDGYTVLKSLEAVGVGQTLIDVDGPSNGVFLNEVVTSVCSKFGFDYTKSNIFHIMNKASIPFRHELMCLMKVMGHPFVDMKAGSVQLHDIATKQLDIDAGLLANCVRHAKRSYIKNHILKHHAWPPCIIAGSPRLAEAKRDQRDPDAAIYTNSKGQVRLEEYDYVELEKNMKFDKCENLIPFIKDKTISVLRSGVVAKYGLDVLNGNLDPISRENCDINIPNPDLDKTDGPTVDEMLGIASPKNPSQRDIWKETRLLLYYMVHDAETVDHLNYIEKFCMNESFDFGEILDYLVMRIVPKEKEMKVDFRGFGCKSFLDRARSVIAEHNVANFMSMYCPEQSMTLSELEILQRLLNFRRIGKAYKSYEPLYIVIDASKWNNRFRTETVNPVAANLLDNVFDCHFFKHVMPVFEHTLVYVPDNSEIWWWWGQLGGIEGHHQYLWDVVYLAQIRSAIEGCGFDPILFVKGDDLRAVIMIPPNILKHKTKEDIRVEVVQAIKDNIKKLGHDINVNESYGSSKYFAFSKAASVGLIELPQTFRKVEKCYGANNAFIPFLDEYVGSSYSNAHSSAKVTCNVVHCYAVAVYWMYFHLCKHEQYKDLTDDELIGLSLVPSILGGFPIIYLHNMWVRAESDLLSPFLDLLNYMKQDYPSIALIMSRFLKVQTVDPQENILGLLLDCYSLPIKKPIASSTALRNEMKKKLKNIIKNETIIELFNAAESEEMKLIIKCFASANIYSAKLMSAIYANGPAGLLDELLRKFESGRSVIQCISTATSRRYTERVIKRLVRNEQGLHKFRRKVVRDQHTWTVDTYDCVVRNYNCPGEAAYELRKYLWNKPVEGVTMPPVQHQLTIEDPKNVASDKWAHRNHFDYILKTPSTTLVDEYDLPFYTSCDNRPFIGYTTKLGVTVAKEQLIDNNDVTTKAKNLIDLLSWVRLSSGTSSLDEPNLESVIYHLLTFFFDIDPSKLTVFKADRAHGTSTHHVRAPHYRESIVANSLSNPYTRFIGKSNSHMNLRWSGHHYLVNFLHLYCHSVFLATIRFQVCNIEIEKDIKMWGITSDCSFCNTPISEPPVHVDLDIIKGVKFHRFHRTKLSKEARKIIEESLSTVKVKLERMINPADALSIEVAASALLQEQMVMSHIVKQRINDYDYRHQMSAEAENIISSFHNVHRRSNMKLTEIKHMSTDVLLHNILPVVIEFVYSEHRTNDIDNAGVWLSTIPPSEFPWTELIQLVYDAGRLTNLVNYASRKSGLPAPSCYDSVYSSSVFIAKSCYHIFSQNSKYNEFPVVFLSSFHLDDLDKLITPRAKILKHRLAKQKLYPMLTDILSSSDDQEKSANLSNYLKMMISYWCTPLFDKAELEEQMRESSLNRSLNINILDYSKLTQEDIVHFRELPRCCHAFFLLKHFKPIYDTCLTELQENISELNRCRTLISNYNARGSLEFVHASVEACVARVRSGQQYFPFLKAREGLMDFDEGPQEDFRIFKPNKKLFNIFEVKTYKGSSTVESLESIKLSEIKHPYDVYMRPWYINRFVGFGTSAPSKLVEIFSAFGLDELPMYSAYTALADGHGGFISTMDRLTSGSHLQFNTLIDNDNMEVHPSSWDSDFSTNDMNYDATINHQSDLTLSETVQAMEHSFEYLSQIITCDAQTYNLDLGLRYHLLRNVTVYYLRNRLPDGMLIIKLYMDELKLNMRLIHTLNQYCVNIYLMKPKASGNNMEMYLICFGTISRSLAPSLDLFELDNYVPSVTVVSNIVEWCDKMINRYNGKKAQTLLTKFDLTINPKLIVNHSLVLSRLSTFCGITVQAETWSQLEQSKMFSQISSYFKKRSFEAIKELNYHLDKIGDPDFGLSLAFNPSTLTHKEILIGHMFRCGGFRVVLDHFETNQEMSEYQLRNTFVKFYYNLREHTGIIPADHHKFFNGDPGYPNGIKFYHDFVLGAEIGLMMIGVIRYKFGLDAAKDPFLESKAKPKSELEIALESIECIM